ncbi:MAG TPA: thymidine kinase [Coxiellaceae bacterium]|nr:MAG: thymidine kinase [Gammaproteobacteria bacterium RBG_16_37_9]HBS51541.1 thymidine kinase [Coxiellaceae bacterium]
MAKLHFYYSTMNAGKSTSLLQSNYNYNERGMNTLLLAPSVDTRYGAKKITSRIGLQADATAFSPDEDLYQFIKQELDKNSNIKCILLDEAQFITKKQVQQLAYVTDDFNIPVLAYGLRTDYMGEPFEASKYFLALADQLIELKTICHCGRKATMVLRVNDQGEIVRKGEQVAMGGNESYIPVCRKHFREGKL